ncbi:MAG TPA: hypothetical protein VGX71_04095 [Pseudaminobacter sp.]|nr:hypothetical protein [Pseudaminobacter sp.]
MIGSLADMGVYVSVMVAISAFSALMCDGRGGSKPFSLALNSVLITFLSIPIVSIIFSGNSAANGDEFSIGRLISLIPGLFLLFPIVYFVIPVLIIMKIMGTNNRTKLFFVVPSIVLGSIFYVYASAVTW